jgi:glycerophosphoryl diester phosphodiesterase
MGKFFIVGHRGASAYAPENTLLSLEEAVARHADKVEFDLRKTADGYIVLLHDRTIVTAAGERQLVSKMSFKEIGDLAERQGRKLATLDEVLIGFGPRIPLNIEIKGGGFEAQVIEHLRSRPPGFEPTVSSFLPWTVARIKRLDGKLKTALILGREGLARFNILAWPIVREIVRALRIDSIHLKESIASPAAVENLSRAGLSVFIWTVNDPDSMRRFLRMGVDGIITDKPDVLYDICVEMAGSEKPILRREPGSFGKFAYAT